MTSAWLQLRTILYISILCLSFSASASGSSPTLYWMKIKASSKIERSEVTNMGLTIESINGDTIIALGTHEELSTIQKSGRLLTHFPLTGHLLDYPHEDAAFHNYEELKQAMRSLAEENSDLVEMVSLGQSYEGREIFHLRISTDLNQSHEKPGIYFLGGHHAREHLSVEVPLMLAQYLVNEYKQGNERVQKLLEGREIHITPIVNPDGAEHDIANGHYKMWRKNRRPVSEQDIGVDLNRNYDYMWATGGASDKPYSQTYHGPRPFSEPETQAVKHFVETHPNISVLLSFHTFSELILYPWGHTYEHIGQDQDRRVHEVMAQKMSQWNGYSPMQSSNLYISSGDTTDWSYGVHGIISFTFELDPKSQWDGGFYPGADKIDGVFNKNLKACLYLMEYADNPYRVLEPQEQKWGLSTPLFQGH